MMESTYSVSSLVGLVSSIRMLQTPPNSCATPKLRQIDLAWPMCRYPFGSGGKRVRICECFPAFTSSTTMSRMKSDGGAGSWICSFMGRRESSRVVAAGYDRRHVGGDPVGAQRLSSALKALFQNSLGHRPRYYSSQGWTSAEGAIQSVQG